MIALFLNTQKVLIKIYAIIIEQNRTFEYLVELMSWLRFCWSGVQGLRGMI